MRQRDAHAKAGAQFAGVLAREIDRAGIDGDQLTRTVANEPAGEGRDDRRGWQRQRPRWLRTSVMVKSLLSWRLYAFHGGGGDRQVANPAALVVEVAAAAADQRDVDLLPVTGSK